MAPGKKVHLSLASYRAILQVWGTGVRMEILLRTLGLSNAADTMVGNTIVRGVSGGERKRVTSAEMLVGPKVPSRAYHSLQHGMGWCFLTLIAMSSVPVLGSFAYSSYCPVSQRELQPLAAKREFSSTSGHEAFLCNRIHCGVHATHPSCLPISLVPLGCAEEEPLELRPHILQ